MRHVVLALMVLSGCASPSGECKAPVCTLPDLSAITPSDLGDPGDLSSPVAHDLSQDLPKVYEPATIHDIDTGGFATNTLVLISGAVFTTNVAVRATSGGMCTYQAWVQDPAGAAPSGIQLFTVQSRVGASCAAVPTSGPFVSHVTSDIVDIRGRLFVQAFAGDGASLTQHSVLVDSFTTVGANGMVTPTALHDPTIFGGYGAGFQSYEGMVVTLSCTSATAGCTDHLKVLFQPNPYLWAVTGGALFGSEFATAYPGLPGANGTAYSTITGVANTFLSGSLEPRVPADFVP